jgi:hypothetical protein
MMDLKVIGSILQFGFSGVAFFLLYFAFQLLRAEQNKTQPRRDILNAITTYMIFAVIVGVLGIISGNFDSILSRIFPQEKIAVPNFDCSKLTALEQLANESKEELDRLNNFYAKNIADTVGSDAGSTGGKNAFNIALTAIREGTVKEVSGGTKTYNTPLNKLLSNQVSEISKAIAACKN